MSLRQEPVPWIFPGKHGLPADASKVLTILPMPPRCDQVIRLHAIYPAMGSQHWLPNPTGMPNAGLELHHMQTSIFFCPSCFSMASVILASVLLGHHIPSTFKRAPHSSELVGLCALHHHLVPTPVPGPMQLTHTLQRNSKEAARAAVLSF